jgi:hypothetical protein
MRKALDLVHVVCGHQLAAAGLGKIGKAILAAKIPRLQIEVEAAPGRIPRKGGMRLVENSGFDVNLVHAVGDIPRRSGQFDAGAVVIARRGNRRGGRRNQRIRTFEIIVLQRRLVHLPDEIILVGGIGLRRVQMLGPLGKSAVEDSLARLARRIRVIPFPAAAGEHQHTSERDEETHRPSLAEHRWCVTPV